MRWREERQQLQQLLDTTAYRQQDVADEAGVSLASVSKMYRGVAVGQSVVRAVADAVGRLSAVPPSERSLASRVAVLEEAVERLEWLLERLVPSRSDSSR